MFHVDMSFVQYKFIRSSYRQKFPLIIRKYLIYVSLCSITLQSFQEENIFDVNDIFIILSGPHFLDGTKRKMPLTMSTEIRAKPFSFCLCSKE